MTPENHAFKSLDSGLIQGLIKNTLKAEGRVLLECLFVQGSFYGESILCLKLPLMGQAAWKGSC